MTPKSGVPYLSRPLPGSLEWGRAPESTPARRILEWLLAVACGVGTVARYLAREGYTMIGLDAVQHLVRVARAKVAFSGGNPRFEHLDLARDPLPEAGTIDVLVSMHTLYWH